MGLDMYLTRQTSFSNFPHNNAVTITPKDKDGNKANSYYFEGVSSIVQESGYWRKANQIHNWFVENVQEGEDDCKRYYVSVGQLESLLDTCKKVLADHALAESLLPTGEGFFFGSTDYDEWYYEQLEDTVKMLEKELVWVNNAKFGEGVYGVDYYYQSSW